MRYVIDSEFIDTPDCSALISLAIVADDGRSKYFEFLYPHNFVTPWLEQHVVPHLTQRQKFTFDEAARHIANFVGDDTKPEFWAYFGAYDWYWFCRLFGGFMQLPRHWPNPILYRDLAQYRRGGITSETQHNALSDAIATMGALKVTNERDIRPPPVEMFYKTSAVTE